MLPTHHVPPLRVPDLAGLYQPPADGRCRARCSPLCACRATPRPSPQVPDLVELYQKGETKLDAYITHTMPFDDINRAFELLHSGQCLRCVLTFQ